MLPPPSPPAAAAKAKPTPYLTFDPAVSPHYEVVLIPVLPPPPPPVFCLRKLFELMDDAEQSFDDDEEVYLSMEWPPRSQYWMEVFSSMTGQWEERDFVREGEMVTTVDDMEAYWFVPRQGYGVFWQGALFSLSNRKYQVIRSAVNIYEGGFTAAYLGKSNIGVCARFGFIDGRQLSVWILDKSAGQMEWV
uniref:Uncharacterized protein n=1 Tax=Leersia perrieri TaxID=77586 RepID=A0A0D9XUF7_9ORYZ